jgi:eukaryotic-like serine/threonine-protein kinase
MTNKTETLIKGRYQLFAQQSSGGMAVIYKALDVELRRIVAVRILRPSMSSDPASIMRFKNQAISIANLQHPNIVTVHDIGNDEAMQFSVMEFVEGQDLKKIIKKEGGINFERALRIAIEICAGIGYVHKINLVHGDMKPQHVLISRNDSVKIIDFGIIPDLSGNLPEEKSQVINGTPDYFSPEQAMGNHPSSASDVYSIGIVMFEMLTGRLPYTGLFQEELTEAHINAKVPVVNELNPDVPKELADIVYKIMNKEPGERYGNAIQLGHVLSDFLKHYKKRASVHTDIIYPRLLEVSPAQGSSTINATDTQIKSLSVFVSYAKKNSHDRTRLVNALQAKYSVWFDQDLEDKGGQDWWTSILHEVRQRQLFVFTLTPDSLLSFACYLEYTYAFELGKRVLPVRTTSSDIDYNLLPKPLRINQVVEFTTAEGTELLLRSIEDLDMKGFLVSRFPGNNIPAPPVPFEEFRPIARKVLNTKQELNESDQRLLVSQLEDLIKTERTQKGALILLQLLQERNDTRHMIAEKIIPLIKQYSSKSINPLKKLFGLGH